MKFLVMLMAVLVAAAGCVSNVEELTPVPTPYPTAVGFSQPEIEPIGIGMVSHVTAFSFPDRGYRLRADHDRLCQ